MRVVRRREWSLPEHAVTPESVVLNRRKLLGFGAGAAVSIALPATARAFTDIAADLYPAPRDAAFVADRTLTDEGIATTYNNFYEFGSHKRIVEAAQALEVRPWEVVIDGLVAEEKRLDAEELISAMPLEERIYRHRCVEAWSMTVPWTGFAFAELVRFAEPLADARYVRMETFMDPEMAPGQKQFWYPWPYVEGMTMAEATNDLAFIGTGLYGKPMPKQNGAPLRLVAPWKYGFKSIKSVVRFTFTDTRPVSFWEEIQPSEYGFWANVNPEVPHPRWSQATERILGSDERVPTLLYNGYAEQVAGLYENLENERLFM